MTFNRALQAIHALAWLLVTLLGGCEVAPPTAIVEPVAFIDTSPKPVDTVATIETPTPEPATPKLAPPEVSPDCTCGPKCVCAERSGGGCNCDAETRAKIAAIPTVKESLTVEEPATGKESLQVPKLLDPAKYPAILANEVKCWDVLIEVPHPSQGYCKHCHRWLEPEKGQATCPNYELQKAGYKVGVLYDPVWADGENLPRIHVGGRTFVGFQAAATLIRYLPPKATYKQTRGLGLPPESKLPPVVRVQVGNVSAGGVSVGSHNVLTASHVAHGGWPHAVEIDGTAYPATVVKDDDEHDLALLHYDGPSTPSIALAGSEPAEGAAATAWGFPAGGALKKHATTLSRRWGNTTSPGLYHSRHAFVPGDSGGPVVNAAGELVGIVTGTDMNRGIGLVVDLPSIRAFLDASQPGAKSESLGVSKSDRGVAHDVTTSRF